MTRLKNYASLFMWFVPLLFFSYQFILRLWPGLCMSQIMEQFHIDAKHFGMLAAFYYYGYAGMQIPMAILLEKYSTRYIIGTMAFLCGIANLLFCYTDNFYLALLSRFLIGATSAVAFLGISKVASQWFAKTMYARIIGFSFTFGLMGAIYGGKPITMFIQAYGWHQVAFVLSCVSIMIGTLAYVMLRAPQVDMNPTKNSFTYNDFMEMIKSPVIWLLAFANLLMVGALEGFADVWGVQYLTAAYDLSNSEAASYVSFIFLGMLFGGPLLTLCNKFIGHYQLISVTGFGMSAIFLLILYQRLNAVTLCSLFFVLGIFCCYQVLVFAVGASLVSPVRLGIAIAFLNCINMLGGSFFHTIIGYIIDLKWNGALQSNHLKLYDVTHYQYALTCIPICATIGAFIVLCIYWRYSSSKQSA